MCTYISHACLNSLYNQQLSGQLNQRYLERKSANWKREMNHSLDYWLYWIGFQDIYGHLRYSRVSSLASSCHTRQARGYHQCISFVWKSWISQDISSSPRQIRFISRLRFSFRVWKQSYTPVLVMFVLCTSPSMSFLKLLLLILQKLLELFALLHSTEIKCFLPAVPKPFQEIMEATLTLIWARFLL